MRVNGDKGRDAVQAREIMSSPVLTVTPETPVRDAVQLMLGNHISGLRAAPRIAQQLGDAPGDVLPA